MGLAALTFKAAGATGRLTGQLSELAQRLAAVNKFPHATGLQGCRISR
jgi:hypothetical protein